MVKRINKSNKKSIMLSWIGNFKQDFLFTHYCFLPQTLQVTNQYSRDNAFVKVNRIPSRTTLNPPLSHPKPRIKLVLKDVVYVRLDLQSPAQGHGQIVRCLIIEILENEEI